MVNAPQVTTDARFNAASLAWAAAWNAAAFSAAARNRPPDKSPLAQSLPPPCAQSPPPPLAQSEPPYGKSQPPPFTEPVLQPTISFADLLTDVAKSGIELVADDASLGLDIARQTPNCGAAEFFARRSELLALLRDGYTPQGADAELVFAVRLIVAAWLGEPIHIGSPAWLLAVAAGMMSQRLESETEQVDSTN